MYFIHQNQLTETCVRNRSGVVFGGSKQWRHSHFGNDGVHFLSNPHVKVRSELHELFTQNSFPKVEHLTVKLVCQLRLPSQPTVSTSLLPFTGSVQLTTRIKMLLSIHDTYKEPTPAGRWNTIRIAPLQATTRAHFLTCYSPIHFYGS